MSRLVARRNRLVRVRHVQHMLAVADTLAAQQEVDAIARNADRLARVRSDLFANPGLSSGGSFGAYRELADRLEQAGRQLDGALYDARARARAKADARMSANREKEIVERLRDRALAQAEDHREARIAAIPAYRKMQPKGD